MSPSRSSAASPALDRRLLAYIATAGAVLAVAGQDAEASPVTRVVNLPVAPNAPTSFTTLDVDNNGIDDFVFGSSGNVLAGAGYLLPGTYFPSGFGNPTNAFFGGNKGGSVLPTYGFGVPMPYGSGQWGPQGLRFGSKTSGPTPSAYLINQAKLAAAGSAAGGNVPTLKGGEANFPSSWAYPFLLQFDIDGARHFGWARVRTQFTGPNTLDTRIVDVGWETTAETDIHEPGPVPEPGSLGLLALGAAGLVARRRKASQSREQ